MLRAVLLVAVPLTLLAAWLEYTHSIRLAADGTYHVGQSTYGDLQLHLAVATSAVNAKFPLQNSLMIGATMAYPYLNDTFATSMYTSAPHNEFSSDNKSICGAPASAC